MLYCGSSRCGLIKMLPLMFAVLTGVYCGPMMCISTLVVI
jgi:hypothetical protein